MRMKGFLGWSELALVMIGISVVPRPAHACETLWIEAPAEIRKEVRSAFDGRADVDRCAMIKVDAATPSRTRIEVLLPDGRTAARVVSRRDDVVPTLEALLVVPPPAPPLPEEPSPAIEPSVPTERTTFPEVPGGAPMTSPAADNARSPRWGSTPSNLRIELDALAGFRVGSISGLGAGLASFVDLTGWLVGVQGRIDSYGDVAGEGDVISAIELTPLLGRRFGLGSLAFDLVGGIGLMTNGSSVQEDVSPIGTHREEQDSLEPRAVASARLVFGARRTTRLFLAIDGAAGPVSDRATARVGPQRPLMPVPDNLAMPVATLGFSIGGAVGTR